MARKKSKDRADTDRSCTIKSLPKAKLEEAARVAVQQNPANAPLTQMMVALSGDMPEKGALVALTQKYWGSKGVDLGVFFFDTNNAELKQKILHYMNLWNSKGANVRFKEASRANAQVRIAFDPDGYWSYLGTDVLMIGKDDPTMNLEAFSLSTPDSTFKRVVPHETGHTLGYPHEHLRKEIIELLDPQKTIAYFRRQYGWNERMTRSNVLTPIDDISIMGSTEADDDSVMCYELPAEITRNGQAIKGGPTINDLDYRTTFELYPGSIPPPSGAKRLVVEYTGDAKGFKIVES